MIIEPDWERVVTFSVPETIAQEGPSWQLHLHHFFYFSGPLFRRR